MSIEDDLGIENGDISRRIINRTIYSLRTKFFEEDTNYYHLLVPYLTNHNEKFPTLSIVQINKNN